ncbi:MAG: PEP-CTERM sorting domain-containing protein, partial [Planctomycetes bacterium]|nr:PEP-CTERM sorting domain-containing protein [Planctomycetota bacterium]
EPSNWSPFVPPGMQGPGGPLDTVNFDLGTAPSTPYVVTDVGGESDQLIVHNDSVHLSIIDYVLLSTGGTNPSLEVGTANGETANLILSGDEFSVLETQVARIANAAGSTGAVTVRGLQWISGNMRIGPFDSGPGTLTIEDDATVSSTTVSIGHFLTSSGAVAVHDGGAWTTSGELLIGRDGTGELTISAGGSVTSFDGSIGEELTGEGTVFVGGFQATWTNTNSLTVGNSGEGSLSINSGGAVNNADAFVGRLIGSDGQVVSRLGSNWTTTGRLSIGGDADTGISGGSGAVAIQGGNVSVTEDIVLFPSGILTFDGGLLSTDSVTLQAGGQFVWNSGSLRLNGFSGNLVNQGGLLLLHPDSNTIAINGSYTQDTAGSLSIFIHGEAATNQYDSINVSATALLGGELRFALDADSGLYEPSPDEVYTILAATELIGSFSNIASGQRVDDGNNAGSFVVHYGPGSPFNPDHVVLTSFQIAGSPGDYNNDGTVDAADYVVWRKNVGTTNPLLNDHIGGLIGPGHYDQWRTHFGETHGGGAGVNGSGNAAVPEPTSLALLLIATVLNIGRRRTNSPRRF